MLVILEQTRKRPTNQTAHSGSQLHFELVASTRLLTDVTTLDAALAIVATCPAEGLGDPLLTALVSASTDDLTALV